MPLLGQQTVRRYASSNVSVWPLPIFPLKKATIFAENEQDEVWDRAVFVA